MIRLVLISALVALAVARTPEVRPIVPMLDGRIVGGSPADIKELPYQVSLQSRGSHICGGAIIGPNKVVTAAHCTYGASAGLLSIRAGSTTRNSGGVVVNVAWICKHPGYNPSNTDNDVSVLILESDLTFSDSIQAINLPSVGSTVPDGTLATVSGWGTLSSGGSLPSGLQKVEVPKVSLASCRDAYGQSRITGSMTCYGYPKGGKDSCQGDSGGPLAINGVLNGIVSWGRGCAVAGYPGVYCDPTAAIIRNHIDSCKFDINHNH